ncbi:hypothetical protein GUITHDRAFT_64472 [Guillardia theta CCMP2712]|uniref:(R)-citramalate synthase n=1 Tax=Guillardia theta (strain CCMP2712) TaxID=905079 RepID=L1JY85_GUITC|nr:hypothetical protein GUITHDRAFT_64472 [Guillardia theta CCMP2712]EKX53307.1 hypothetical protein GUITHDRAFT_64472 [Guillardia theta CCMP2712]|eukprot:XP_005840287.1 hypothetical protein GUITHDRAFT_64472 [Guillardia theta CCMP2712]
MIASDPSVKGVQVPPAQRESLPVRYYDTTLRDGAQGEGISLSCDDKLRIASRLHRFGVDYIEGGWPGSNPKDAEFFERAKVELPPAAWDKVAAFGSTRYKNVKVEDDKQVKMLVDSGARVVTLVGKSWDLHVDQVLETSREENLAMIFDTVSYLKSLGREVMLDAEHFFDGYSANPEYAMSCLDAAVNAGVDWLVLCDTNGGSLPWDIEELTREVVTRFPTTNVGIHCHNDQGMAVANSLAAVKGGARVIQGTVNGYGERTGNANAMSILPTLSLAMKEDCTIGLDHLKGITSLSRYVDEQANQPNNPHAAYVGSMSFATQALLMSEAGPSKSGNIETGKQVLPEAVKKKAVVARFVLTCFLDDQIFAKIMQIVRSLDQKGYFFEGHFCFLPMNVIDIRNSSQPPFEILDYNVIVWDDGPSQYGNFGQARATVVIIALTVQRQGTEILEVAEGNGPVNALGKALKQALLPLFSSLEFVELRDYKVRILDNEAATAAVPRVMIEFQDTQLGKRWTTASADSNIISASFNALVDGVEYHLEHRHLVSETRTGRSFVMFQKDQDDSSF